MLLTYLLVFSATSFIFFGASCFTGNYMKEEFVRYRLQSYRTIVGFLQLGGALALLLGFKYQWALLLGSGGLALLMMLGFLVRLRIKDGFWKSSPSFIYMIINMIIFFCYSYFK